MGGLCSLSSKLMLSEVDEEMWSKCTSSTRFGCRFRCLTDVRSVIQTNDADVYNITERIRIALVHVITITFDVFFFVAAVVDSINGDDNEDDDGGGDVDMDDDGDEDDVRFILVKYGSSV